MVTVQVSAAAVLATGMVVATVTAQTITKVDQVAGRGSGMAQATAAGRATTTGTVEGTASETSTLGQLR